MLCPPEKGKLDWQAIYLHTVHYVLHIWVRIFGAYSGIWFAVLVDPGIWKIFLVYHPRSGGFSCKGYKFIPSKGEGVCFNEATQERMLPDIWTHATLGFKDSLNFARLNGDQQEFLCSIKVYAMHFVVQFSEVAVIIPGNSMRRVGESSPFPETAIACSASLLGHQ